VAMNAIVMQAFISSILPQDMDLLGKQSCFPDFFPIYFKQKMTPVTFDL
jgi:hypothetical protein